MFEEKKEYTQNLLDESDLVCTISEEEEKERTPNIIYLRDNVIEIKRVEYGYTTIFPYQNEVAHSLLDFILKEHDCCPFFPFDLSFNKEKQIIEFTVQTDNSQKGENIGEIFKTIFDI